MAAPEAGHDRRHAVQRSLLGVDAGDAGEILAPEHLVQMARENGVDAGHLCQVQRGVLLAALALAALDAGMAQRQQHVALAAQFGHMPLRGVHDVLGRHLAGQIALVPLHDLRRHEADDADAQPLLAPGFVHDLLVEDHPGLHQRRAVGLDEVGAHEGEFGAAQREAEEGEPVVELVIAQRGAGVVERVHASEHGVHVAGLHAALVGDEVAHRAALDQVAIVEQHAVLRFRARGGDQRRGACEADRVVGLVAVIIIGQHVDVQVGGLHQPQLDARLLGERGRARQNGRAENCPGSDHDVAAGDRGRGPGLGVDMRGEGVGHRDLRHPTLFVRKRDENIV